MRKAFNQKESSVSQPIQVLQFTRAGKTFVVKRDDTAAPQFAFIGYCDGELSVSGDRADVVSRGLLRKHVNGLPQGSLVALATARAKRRALLDGGSLRG